LTFPELRFVEQKEILHYTIKESLYPYYHNKKQTGYL
jgi:hypothetical protein